MGRDGDPVDPADQPDQQLSELSERERALRGRPGERSRAALADLAREVEQRLAADVASGFETDAPDPAADSAATHPRVVLGTCVDVVVGARRLAGWCEYLQVLAVARLLAAWSGRPPIVDERVGPDPCGLGEFADPALADRLHAVADGLRVFVPAGEHLDTAELADEFVASEVAAAAGISLTAGRTRVTAAAALFLSDRLPRTRILLRAGPAGPDEADARS